MVSPIFITSRFWRVWNSFDNAPPLLVVIRAQRRCMTDADVAKIVKAQFGHESPLCCAAKRACIREWWHSFSVAVADAAVGLFGVPKKGTCNIWIIVDRRAQNYLKLSLRSILALHRDAGLLDNDSYKVIVNDSLPNTLCSRMQACSAGCCFLRMAV
eukprot:6477001-Amphidinium_carterae.1